MITSRITFKFRKDVYEILSESDHKSETTMMAHQIRLKDCRNKFVGYSASYCMSSNGATSIGIKDYTNNLDKSLEVRITREMAPQWIVLQWSTAVFFWPIQLFLRGFCTDLKAAICNILDGSTKYRTYCKPRNRSYPRLGKDCLIKREIIRHYSPFYWRTYNHWRTNWMSSGRDYPINGTWRTEISYVSRIRGWTRMVFLCIVKSVRQHRVKLGGRGVLTIAGVQSLIIRKSQVSARSR